MPATAITATTTARRTARCKSYLIGFVLSVVLTAIPFWLVMSGVLGSKQATAFVIMVFAAVQIVVHMVYFLHMNAEVRRRLDADGADLHAHPGRASRSPARCGSCTTSTPT